jgi:AP2-associated kinase
MLREHGTQRPSVYEVLDAVHRMRGTKSSFHYVREMFSHTRICLPFTSSFPQTAKPKPKPIPTAPSNAMPIPSFVSPPLPTSVGAPYQVRKQDLETIQPMRRGRPSGVPVVPLKAIKSGPVRVQTQPQPKSPVTAEAPRFDAMFGSASTVSKDDGSAWGKVIGKFATQTKNGTSTFDGFADSFDGLSAQMISPSLPPTRPSPSPQVPVASGQRQEQTRPSEKSRKSPAVDAFEGLGVSFGSSSKAPTPTLGSMSSGGPLNSFLSVPSGAGVRSPSAPYLSPPTQSSPGFDWNNNQRRPSFSSSKSPVVSSSPSSELSVEERFPSIESLTSMDPSSFGSISSSAPSPAPIPAQAASALPKTTTQRKTPSPTSTSAARPQFTRQGSALTQFTRTSYTGGGLRPGPSATNAGLSVGDSPAMAGARSQQVTGTAMREARAERPLWDADYKPTPKSSPAKPEGAPKPVGRRQSQDFGFSTSSIAIESARSQQKTPPLPKRPSPAPAPAQPKDWLTGDIDDIPPSLPPFQAQPSLPPLSTSVNKRASAFLSSRNTGTGTAPRETNPPISSTNLPLRSRPSKEKAALTGTRNHDKPPPSATTESSGEEGPEDPIAVTRPAWVPDSSKATNLIRKQVEKEKEQKEGPASPRVLKPLKHVKRGSVYDLVDVAPSNPVASSKQTPVKQKPTSEDLIGTSSSSDHAQAPPLKPKTPTTERTVRTGAARRQSSVGDLLDFGPPSPRERRTASTIDTSPTPASRKFAPSSSSRFNNPPTPSSPTAADRSRPRSMFMSPTTPTSALLSPPVASSDDGTKSRRSIRRGSISDIVSKYEALNAVETGTSSTKSRISKTPSPTTHSRQMSTSTTSGITRSPESKVAKLGSETKAPNSTNNGDRPPRPPSSSKPNSVNTSRATARRTSTSDSSSGGPPSPAAPRVMRKSTLEAPSFTQAPRSSSPVRLVGMQPQPTRSLTSDSSTSPDNNPPSIDSPSPERPYQGVGKLIDQWQKKTEEAEKEQTPIQRRGGPVRRGFR